MKKSELRNIIRETIKNKIKYLTLFAFSTENWKRPKNEVNFLFNLLEEFLLKKINELKKQGIRLKVIGDKKRFSKKLTKILLNSEKATKKNKILQLNLALSYGSKAELVKAMNLTIKNKIPLMKEGKFKYTFSFENKNINAQYLKINAESVGALPEEHPAAGSNSWIFIDEIIVN